MQQIDLLTPNQTYDALKKALLENADQEERRHIAMEQFHAMSAERDEMLRRLHLSEAENSKVQEQLQAVIAQRDSAEKLLSHDALKKALFANADQANLADTLRADLRDARQKSYTALEQLQTVIAQRDDAKKLLYSANFQLATRHVAYLTEVRMREAAEHAMKAAQETVIHAESSLRDQINRRQAVEREAEADAEAADANIARLQDELSGTQKLYRGVVEANMILKLERDQAMARVKELQLRQMGRRDPEGTCGYTQAGCRARAASFDPMSPADTAVRGNTPEWGTPGQTANAPGATTLSREDRARMVEAIQKAAQELL